MPESDLPVEPPRASEPLDWTALCLWLAALLVTAVLYPRLPARLPFHWNGAGEVDLWAARPGAVAFGLLLPALIYLATWPPGPSQNCLGA